MRTPKRLYPSARIIYHPELSTCPRCGGPLMLVNYLLWDKTVQTLERVLSVASRPACCADPTCPGATMRLRSAAGQQLALPHSSYGADVMVRIGWSRQEHHATFAEIHATLIPHVAISEAQVRHLYQQVYLPLLACHERQQADRLVQAAHQHGGLILALDGLAPDGGEPQLWCIRELLTGLVLRSGWLSRQDQATFETFLQPVSELTIPIRAIVSDKQRGLVPAIATRFPHTPHQFCQSHYLRNLAEPLAAVDSALNVTLRQAVRQELGTLLLTDAPAADMPAGVLTMTGLLAEALPPVGATRTIPAPLAPAAPSALPLAAANAPDRSMSESSVSDSARASTLVTQLLRRTRYLLTLKGRPPFRLAGLEAYQQLEALAETSATWLAHRHDPRLATLAAGLQTALAAVASTVAEVAAGATWLQEIATILAPPPAQLQTGAQVAAALDAYLSQLTALDCTERGAGFRRHLQKVTASYAPGLFHCYDLAGVPRTNNGMESHFRDTQRRLLRTSGQKGASRRSLHRLGAWELIPRPPSEAACLAALRQVGPSDLAVEQQRIRQHAERFRLHTRSRRRATAQLDQLEQQWLALPGTATG